MIVVAIVVVELGAIVLVVVVVVVVVVVISRLILRSRGKNMRFTQNKFQVEQLVPEDTLPLYMLQPIKETY